MYLRSGAAYNAEAFNLANLAPSDTRPANVSPSPDNPTIPNNLLIEDSDNVIGCKPDYFSLLPTEIQLEIWSLAHEPRVIQIKAREVDDPANRKEYLHPGKQACYSVAKEPVGMHVCRRSRELGMSVYNLQFGERLRRPIWFNGKTDVILIADTEVLTSFMLVAFDPYSLALLEKDDLKFLAVDLVRHYDEAKNGRTTDTSLTTFPAICTMFNGPLEKVFMLNRDYSTRRRPWAGGRHATLARINARRLRPQAAIIKWPTSKDVRYNGDKEVSNELQVKLIKEVRGHLAHQ